MLTVKRTIALLGLTMTSILATNVATARDLTIVSWGGNFQDAQREIYFQPFSKASHQKVLDQSWDGGIGVLEAKVRAGNPNWDVVEVEAEDLALGCAAGVFEKIDWKALGGQDKFLPTAVSRCGVGTIVWSTGLAYDADKLKVAPTSWADFWDLKKFPGKRGFRKGPKYALEFALIADGVPRDKVYETLRTPAGVDRAFAKLDQIKSQIVWWGAAAQSLQLLASGDVTMTTAYNGRITGFNQEEGKHFKMVWKDSIPAVDSWVILKGSSNKGEAMKFIAFASEPENQAKLPKYIAYGLTNKAANALVPENILDELPTKPSHMAEALPLDAEFWAENIEPLTKRFNAWVAK